MSVGVVNTAIHWGAFLCLAGVVGLTQAIANLVAFCMAVTFSFFANARWTFQARSSLPRYLLYVGFMGSLALGLGWAADRAHLHPLLTLVGFSATSLMLGYAYSRLVVFKGSK